MSPLDVSNGRNTQIILSQKTVVYIEFDISFIMLRTYAELIKHHRRFFCSSSYKVLYSLNFASSCKANQNTEYILKTIAAHFNAYERYSWRSARFGRILPTIYNAVIRDKLSINRMFFDGDEAFQIVDTDILFPTATFQKPHNTTDGQTAGEILPAFVLIWDFFFSGYQKFA